MSNLILIHCGFLLLLFLSCVSAEKTTNSDGLDNSEFSRRFSLWPSVHNGASLIRYRRQSQNPTEVAGPHEGVSDVSKPLSSTEVAPVHQQVDQAVKKNDTINNNNKTEATVQQEVTPKVSGNTTELTTKPSVTLNETTSNTTVVEKVKQLNLSNPGVVKRGLIVFGGFALMAIAYLIFYRKKTKTNEASNSHSMIDANQFRYGVLQSEDKRDGELSRIPLTMESEDEDDEDLEIFDLEQKKKTLSYVNLQTTDEDVVLSRRETTSAERDDLLLDIEDGSNSETLINWSSNGNKSIL